jgi:hypothetical protein
MEEAVSRDGRKRRLVFEAASERGSDKRHRTCCHGEECEFTTKVLAQESTIIYSQSRGRRRRITRET